MANSDELQRWADLFTAWAEQRAQFSAEEARGGYPKWEYSDDDAVNLLYQVAGILGVEVPEAEECDDDEED